MRMQGVWQPISTIFYSFCIVYSGPGAPLVKKNFVDVSPSTKHRPMYIGLIFIYLFI